MVFSTNSQTISSTSSEEELDMLEWPEAMFIQAESFELRGYDQVVVARLVMQIENCMTKASKTAALRVRERRKPIRNQQT